jgi:predicted phosphodiesterase
VPHLILSDIHGNLEALQAVLDATRGQYDSILCLGDLVGYGADPNAIVEWARANATSIVRGNHDKACCGADSIENYNPSAQVSAVWTHSVLTKENMEYLRKLPHGPLRYEDFDLVHGSPADEDEYIIDIDDAAVAGAYLDAQSTLFGHTHVQGGFVLTHRAVGRLRGEGMLELEPDHFYLLNPGAVGQPRDGDPRAAFALYYPKQGIEYRRVEYDIPTAAGKIRDAGLPDGLAARLFQGQ